MEFFKYLFDTSRFVPRRTCGGWEPWEIWLHNVSDFTIWLSYLAISFSMLYFLHRKPKVGFPFIFYCFVAFIVSCGFTHFMEVMMFYHPAYALAGAIKGVTAVISAGTVLVLWYYMPMALTVKSPAEMEEIVTDKTLELKQTIAKLKETQDRLQIIIDHAPALISYVDESCNYRLVNLAYRKWFGMDPDDMLR